MTILEIKSLNKYYQIGSGIVKAVDNVSMSVEKGEFIAVTGNSGSGKTTLLNLMGGLDYADSGMVVIQRKNIFNMSEEELTVYRRRNIGFIFQNYNLIQNMNVYKNIVMPMLLDGRKPDKDYIENILIKLGLNEKMNVKPNQLSGGQQQRVAIARALSAKPAIVLADEPTGNLDSQTSREVLQLMKRTMKEFQQTVIMITHNSNIAILADRIIRLEDGKIIGGE